MELIDREPLLKILELETKGFQHTEAMYMKGYLEGKKQVIEDIKEMPVVINSESNTKTEAITIPLSEYAKLIKASQERDTIAKMTKGNVPYSSLKEALLAIFKGE